jgi:hypothetical protein
MGVRQQHLLRSPCPQCAREGAPALGFFCALTWESSAMPEMYCMIIRLCGSASNTALSMGLVRMLGRNVGRHS